MSCKWPYVINCYDCGYMEAFREETNREYFRGYHKGKNNHEVESYKVTAKWGLPDLLEYMADKYPNAKTLNPKYEKES